MMLISLVIKIKLSELGYLLGDFNRFTVLVAFVGTLLLVSFHVDSNCW